MRLGLRTTAIERCDAQKRIASSPSRLAQNATMVLRCHHTSVSIVEYYKSFSDFDKDSNGRITSSELATMMRVHGDNPTNAEIKKLVAAMDRDGEKSRGVGGGGLRPAGRVRLVGEWGREGGGGGVLLNGPPGNVDTARKHSIIYLSTWQNSFVACDHL